VTTPASIRPARPGSANGPIDVPQAHLRIDASLVLITVHVTTSAGTPVTCLRRENFRAFEDGAEQKITHFAMDDAPVSIGVLFDVSASMHDKMRKSVEAAAAFFKTAEAGDEFLLIEFSDRPKLTVPFTPDSDNLYQRIFRIRPIGRTALLDAVHLALVQMKSARNLRKAIVILSDGGDNRSRHTARETKNAMLESDVQVYAMGIFDQEESHRSSREEQNGPQLLEELAQETGGRSYPVENFQDLPSIGARIGNELRNQYVLGYAPANGSRDGRFRQVKLNLIAPSGMANLKMYYRPGYRAPAE